MPAALASLGYAFRHATQADAAFERILFETTRPDAAFLAAWPEATRRTFLDQQFHFQTVHYRRTYPQAFRGIVLAHHEPIGRLILDRAVEEWCMLDIALLPSWRGLGLGQALIETIQAEAAQAEHPASITLMVDMSNPARRLYERLGFKATAESMPNVVMAWYPTAQLKMA